MFSYKYCEIFQGTYFEEHLQTTASATLAWYVTTSKNIFSMQTFIAQFRLNFNFREALLLIRINVYLSEPISLNT